MSCKKAVQSSNKRGRIIGIMREVFNHIIDDRRLKVGSLIEPIRLGFKLDPFDFTQNTSSGNVLKKRLPYVVL